VHNKLATELVRLETDHNLGLTNQPITLLCLRGFKSTYYYYYYYYYVVVIVVVVPGTSLEPAVIPTAQGSSFTLQYSPYYV
jgi:hypothetical protein